MSQWGWLGRRCGGRWGELAVGGEGGFEGDEGVWCWMKWAKASLRSWACCWRVPRVTSMPAARSLAMPWPLTRGFGSVGGDDAAGDAGGDEGVGAGAGAAVVGAGLEGYVGGCAGGRDAACGGLFEGCDFGVVALVVEVGAFGDDLAVVGRGRSLPGGWARRGRWCRGRAEGSLHEAPVLLGL